MERAVEPRKAVAHFVLNAGVGQQRPEGGRP
jgi:hypothetical protein